MKANKKVQDKPVKLEIIAENEDILNYLETGARIYKEFKDKLERQMNLPTQPNMSDVLLIAKMVQDHDLGSQIVVNVEDEVASD